MARPPRTGEEDDGGRAPVARPSSSGSSNRVALAAIAGAHGVRGEVRLKLFADDAASLRAHARLFVGGSERRLLELRDGKLPIARFEGVADRSAADALRGALVEVDRSALPPLEDGEYYHADLLGLPCVDGSGARVGHVAAVENFGAGDLLEIEDDSGKRALIPFRDGIADLVKGQIVLDLDYLA